MFLIPSHVQLTDVGEKVGAGVGARVGLCMNVTKQFMHVLALKFSKLRNVSAGRWQLTAVGAGVGVRVGLCTSQFMLTSLV